MKNLHLKKIKKKLRNWLYVTNIVEGDDKNKYKKNYLNDLDFVIHIVNILVLFELRRVYRKADRTNEYILRQD